MTGMILLKMNESLHRCRNTGKEQNKCAAQLSTEESSDSDGKDFE